MSPVSIITNIDINIIYETEKKDVISVGLTSRPWFAAKHTTCNA